MSTFQESWTGFCAEFGARSERLVAEVTGASGDVQSLARGLTEAFEATYLTEIEPGEVESLEALFGGLGQRLFLETVTVYQKKRPLQRTLSAIENYDAALDDLARQLPLTVRVAGRELVEMAGAGVRAAWLRRRLGWQKSPKVVPVRDIVTGFLQRQALRRAVLDGALQLVLAQSCLHLLGPWQMFRRQRLTVLSGKQPDRKGWEDERKWWLKTASKYSTRGARVIQSYRNWSTAASSRLAEALLRRAGELSERKRDKIFERRQSYFSYWARQQRGVQSLLDLERQLSVLARGATEETIRSLESLKLEHDELFKELESVIAWLEAWQREEQAGAFPPPQARLMSAEERIAEWARNISGQTRAHLPAAVESAAPRRALPGWRNPWRRLEPQRVLLNSLERTGREISLGGCREAEAGHRAVVREIERAREVVTFGFESAESEGAEGIHFAREAVTNALSLLLYQKRTASDAGPMAEKGLVQAVAVTFLETHIALEEGQIGLLAYLTRQSGLRAARQLSELALRGLRALFRRAWRGLRDVYQWILFKTGWVTPPSARFEPVTERAYLGQILDVQLGVRDLPMLYGRLFRLAPVEEPRFLVGRDAEMQGLAEALSRWLSGRGVAIIVVGARGSGKTSLLNCAAAGIFSNVPLVRGQFCERVTSPTQLEAFLRGLLRLPHEADPHKTLLEGRRVVVLEEFERTFLRTINGFQALREFLHLIESTAKTTLWILSINETSYRYLDVVAGLSQVFSHRVNAMAVKPEFITNAILQRHNLSGLRLQFAPPSEGDPRISQARRFFGLEEDPQQLFFEALYRQSQGIFRSAFELWQDCIERVEGGVVYMRQPPRPDYDRLFKEMTLDELLTMQAILQHGGLTEEEVSHIFGISIEKGHGRLERLRALEILEPEPFCPGVRVRPEAGRFVRDALHRQNLL
jgi:hypothetical protein